MDPDYSKYDYYMLADARDHIDKEKWPERYNRILEEIEKRKNAAQHYNFEVKLNGQLQTNSPTEFDLLEIMESISDNDVFSITANTGQCLELMTSINGGLRIVYKSGQGSSSEIKTFDYSYNAAVNLVCDFLNINFINPKFQRCEFKNHQKPKILNKISVVYGYSLFLLAVIVFLLFKFTALYNIYVKFANDAGFSPYLPLTIFLWSLLIVQYEDIINFKKLPFRQKVQTAGYLMLLPTSIWMLFI